MADSGLTATMHFGLPRDALVKALAQGAAGNLCLGRNAQTAGILGIGTVQVEAVGAWMRFANLTQRDDGGVALSPLGALVQAQDAELRDPASWWVIHWQLASHYVVWRLLGSLEYRGYTSEEVDGVLRDVASGRSQQTIRNARQSLMKALADTPLGTELGLVQIESDGKRITGLVKLPVRHGTAPMAAVAYALLDWASREQVRSAALETLASSDGPGAILHMSEGALERYLLEIDGAFRGRVMTYSRTAGLNEAYFKPEVTPLQVLASHYLREREGLEWPEALVRAQHEVEASSAP
jgi:hypothetical protein